MNIGVLGAGVIGRTIGQKWAAAGHDVMFGVRDTSKPAYRSLAEAPAAAGGRVRLGTTMAAVDHGEVILVALPGNAVAGVAAAFGAGLDGKILIDATNRIGSEVMNNVAVLAEHAPRAQIYRAFKSLGWENFEEPRLAGEQIDLFFCGPEGAAREQVEGLIRAVGLRPIYVGDLGQVTAVDNITRLYFALAMGQGHGRRLGFKVLTG